MHCSRKINDNTVNTAENIVTVMDVKNINNHYV